MYNRRNSFLKNKYFSESEHHFLIRAKILETLETKVIAEETEETPKKTKITLKLKHCDTGKEFVGIIYPTGERNISIGDEISGIARKSEINTKDNFAVFAFHNFQFTKNAT